MALSWIYAPISNDLLHTIIELYSITMEAWDRLRDIFQDNQHSRALSLEQEFSTTSMENFSNASSYCQHLKSLGDQLKNVAASVSDSRMLLHLLVALPEPTVVWARLFTKAIRFLPFTRLAQCLFLRKPEWQWRWQPNLPWLQPRQMTPSVI